MKQILLDMKHIIVANMNVAYRCIVDHLRFAR